MPTTKEPPKKGSDEKETKRGFGSFEQPEAITASAEEQEKRWATDEQKCKGEHPLTNVPVFAEMSTLTREQSPSRLGFQKLTAGGEEPCYPTGNAAGQPGEGDAASPAQDEEEHKRAAGKRR